MLGKVIFKDRTGQMYFKRVDDQRCLRRMTAVKDEWSVHIETVETVINWRWHGRMMLPPFFRRSLIPNGT